MMRRYVSRLVAATYVVLFFAPLLAIAADKSIEELEREAIARQEAIMRLQAAIMAERARIEAENKANDPNFFSDVSVKIVKKEGQFSDHGSGTVVGCVPDGDKYTCYIVTAAHVVRNAESLAISFFDDGKTIGVTSGAVVGRDAQNDIAIVKVTALRPLPAATIVPEDYKVKPRDPVIAAGCPGGQTPPFVYSNNSACALVIDRYSGGANITTSCMPEQGASGGGLYNAQGQLIGVCSAHDQKEKTGLYTGTKELYNLINKINAGIAISQGGSIVAVPCRPTPKK